MVLSTLSTRNPRGMTAFAPAAVERCAANGRNAAGAVISLRPINWNYGPKADGQRCPPIFSEAVVRAYTTKPIVTLRFPRRFGGLLV